MKKIISIALITCILSACKKDKEETPVPTTTSTTPAGSFYGILTGGVSQDYMGGVLYPYNNAGGEAWFGSTPEIGYSSTNFVTVDSVSLNNVFLKFSDFYYTDTSYIITNLPPITWHVKGAHNIPNFDHTNTTVLPGYTGYTSFPTSIDRSHNLIMPISGISNASKVLVIIADDVGHVVYKNISPTAISVTFTTSELSALSSTAGGYFYVNLKNETVETIGGKSFRFDNFYQVNTYIPIQ